MEQGFIKSLFDFSFTSFVTPKLVRVLYVISLVLIVLIYLGLAIAIFSSGSTTFDPNTGTMQSKGNAGWGLAWLVIGGPILALLYAIFYRVMFELIIVVFRIYETVRDELAVQRAMNPAAAAAVDAASGVQSGPAAQFPSVPHQALPSQPAPPAEPGPPAPPESPGGQIPYSPPGPPEPPAPPNPGA
jgi:hypothetical protein